MDRRRTARTVPPGRPGRRLGILAVFVLVPIGLLLGWLAAAHDANRLDHHSAVVDARIIDSDLGCLGAYGSRSSTGVGWRSSIRYEIDFPYGGGTHTTTVRRPCGVIPPDFGRGRGYIWVEVDRDNPDLVRVVGDDTAHARAELFRVAFLTALAAAGVVLIWRWDRGHRSNGGGPSG